MVENLLAKCDTLIIGGGMANTFLAAKGYNMQDSLVEAGAVETAKAILAKAGGKLLLPVDAVVADKFDAEADSQVVDADKIPAGWRMLDIGPKSIAAFGEVLKKAKLVVWNGPMGVFEFPKFAEGTFAIAKLLAETGATTVIGGGDSASAVKKAGRGEEDDARLHRRRRLARVPGRQGAAGRGGAERQVEQRIEADKRMEGGTDLVRREPGASRFLFAGRTSNDLLQIDQPICVFKMGLTSRINGAILCSVQIVPSPTDDCSGVQFGSYDTQRLRDRPLAGGAHDTRCRPAAFFAGYDRTRSGRTLR